MTATASTPTPSRHRVITESLRDDILRGRFRPGERLPGERDLAARLGVNRSSVREALRRLEQLGLIVIRRGGGATVCELEDASLEVVRHLLFVDGALNRPVLEQLLDVHEMLVVGATRLAVERADEGEVDRALRLLDRLADPHGSDDDFIDAAAALLDLIVAASRNLVLRIARNAVNPLFEARFREARKRLRPSPEVVAPVAAAVASAVAARAAAAAEDGVRRFVRLNRGRAVAALEALHRQGAPLPQPPSLPEEPHVR